MTFTFNGSTQFRYKIDSNFVRCVRGGRVINDLDGDGVIDQNDAFPRDPTEWLDTDGDEIGNNADLDDDNDDMPDSWETASSLNPLLDDANLDKDGDGFTNFEEYKAKTDPNDPKSVPKKNATSWLPLLLE